MKKYYSHVLFLPEKKPFDKPKFKWPTFVGSFIKPVVENFEDPFWFTFYGPYAKFRVYTDKYDLIDLKIRKYKKKLKIADDFSEVDLTLEADLGVERFLSLNRTDKKNKRKSFISFILFTFML